MEGEQGCSPQHGLVERRDAAENRRQIVAAARQLFVEQGVNGTSMQEIACRAGVGKGTLYRRFAHKGELCAALMQDDIDLFQARILATISAPDAPASALERLWYLLDELLGMMESHLPLMAAMQQVDEEGHDDRFSNPLYIWIFTQVRALLLEAVASGEVAALDADFTADAILSVITPSVITCQHQQRGFTRERVAAGVRRLFIDGLRAAPSSGYVLAETKASGVFAEIIGGR